MVRGVMTRGFRWAVVITVACYVSACGTTNTAPGDPNDAAAGIDLAGPGSVASADLGSGSDEITVEDVQEPTADTADDAQFLDTTDVHTDPPDIKSGDDMTEDKDMGTPKPVGPWGFLVPEPDISDVLFVKDQLIDVVVQLNPTDWEELVKKKRTFLDIILGADCLDHPPEKMFSEFPATVTVNGAEPLSVTVRRKGFLGSMSTSKPSLLIKLDTIVPNQRLYGLDRLTLNNMRQDPSHLSTCLAYKVFSDAGYPAPRCGFARVTVNGQYLGVYAHVEAVKKPFLRKYFADDEGNLYEGTLSDFRKEFIGTFEKKTNEKEADFSDVQAVMDTLIDNPGTITTTLDTFFDADRYYTFWALEVLVHHWDGYAGNTNNFFIYGDPQTGKFTFMPWGADSTFMAPTQINPGDPPPASVMATGILPYQLYMSPDGRAAYIKKLKELLDTAWNEEELLETAETWAATILPHLPEKDVGPATADKGRVMEFIQSKRQAILAEIEPTPITWTKPLRGSICWADIGGMEINLSTTWGTKGVGGFWESGTGEVINYVHNNEPSTYTKVGAIAGWELAAGGGLTAVVAVGGLLPNNDLETITMFTKPALLTPNTSIPFDWSSLQAHRHRWPPPYDQPISMGFVADGVMEVITGGTKPGDTIDAKIKAGFWMPVQ